MNQMQAMIDGMAAEWQRERAKTQLTLGGLIEALEALPPRVPVLAIEEPHSYRGYYSDLAFELGEDPMLREEAIDMCRSAMGKVFEGYKGGDYLMGENTPLWLANYGQEGLRIMKLNENGTVETAEEVL